MQLTVLDRLKDDPQLTHPLVAMPFVISSFWVGVTHVTWF